jgi:hypothetical protein
MKQDKSLTSEGMHKGDVAGEKDQSRNNVRIF